MSPKFILVAALLAGFAALGLSVSMWSTLSATIRPEALPAMVMDPDGPPATPTVSLTARLVPSQASVPQLFAAAV